MKQQWCTTIILLYVLLLLTCLLSYSQLNNVTDHLVLLDFKSRITRDPLQMMKSWNDSVQFCSWIGVACNAINRVVILNLEAKKLVGTIPPSIGNLSFVTGINLRNNTFRGEIPQEIGRLMRLQYLNLSWNSFGGKIPTNLSYCNELKVVDLVYNQIVGEIPNQFMNLMKLVYLGFGGNNLTGTIPSWIGNFSSLIAISLAYNNFQGTIPYEIGGLSKLVFFVLTGNKFTGKIPASVFNISSLYYFTFTENMLYGAFPSDIGSTLPNLRVFAGGLNNFSGTFPMSLFNISGLEVVDFSLNTFTSNFPMNVGRLQSLSRLNFDANRLGNRKMGDLDFIDWLVNCSSLEVLGLNGNQFGGVLPESIGNLSSRLRIITLGSNFFHGSIPVGIGKLVNLSLIVMEDNSFSGNVPDSVGNLRQLQGLNLGYNEFSGKIPDSLGNLTSLTRLLLNENRFVGQIPLSLGNLINLLVFNVSWNNLTGSIPKQVTGLSSLSISLAMSHNLLTGSIPNEVGNLRNLAELDLSYNKLSGEIPRSLGMCVRLERLYLEGNLFQGTIPQSTEALKGLLDVDLSRNNFSGTIPDFLAKLPELKRLNLSFNDFEGEVPREGIFANVSLVLVAANDKLCGGTRELHLPLCFNTTDRSSKGFLSPQVLGPVIGVSIFFIMLLFVCLIFYVTKKQKMRPLAGLSRDWLSNVSYADILKSTNGFSEENLIGSGSFGSVYKGLLPGDEKTVAIKVLNLQQQGAYKSFNDECAALKNIRHRNLLKIISICSSVDHQGNDFKALVFVLMSNGSLDEWLHSRTGEELLPKKLSFTQRLNISIDVASALEYLHHHCETPIVHCDLKPGNILLNDDLTAHVGDFGLASFLFASSNNSFQSKTILARLKGSIGYIPPEYGTGGQVSILGDVYSYGILLLEIFTGKRPTDVIFKDGLSLHSFVSMAMPHHVNDIADPAMLFEENNEIHEEDKDIEEDDRVVEMAIINKDSSRRSCASRREECLVAILRVGLECSRALARDRLLMNNVVNRMLGVKERYIGFENRNRRS